MRQFTWMAGSALVLGSLLVGACKGDDDGGAGPGDGDGDTGGSGDGDGDGDGDDASGGRTGGTGGTGGRNNTGGRSTGGSGGGTGGEVTTGGMGGYVPTDRYVCDELAPLGMGGGENFAITSPDFEECGPMPDATTCDGRDFGEGDSPALTWTDGPAGTLSYAIIFKDLSLIEDNGMFVDRAFHWAIWDIPADVTSLPRGLGGGHLPQEIPGARQWGVNNFGYLGPCPNSFDEANDFFPGFLVNDSYSFTIYALEEETLAELPAPAAGVANWVPELDSYLEDNALAVAEYRGTSDAWAATFVPPSVPNPPCTADQVEAEDNCVDAEPD